MDYYAQVLLDEASTPSNWREWLVQPEEECHNASCGDSLAVQATWVESLNGDVLQKVEWHGQGCLLSRASASVLSRELTEKTRSYIAKLGLSEVLELLHLENISPGRVKCVLLFLQCLQRSTRSAGE